MERLKTSFIATVFNEEKSIVKFLYALHHQTVKPDEIIITDGGSTDRTVDLIKNYSKKNRCKITVLIKKGNRSVGRNYAIESAKHSMILCSDAGCTLDKDWVKNISKPFVRKDIDVVAGYYQGRAKSVLAKSLIPYVLVMEDKVNPNHFLPATRSMAFRKSVWEEIGKFPKSYSHNEDYVFAKRLEQNKKRIYFEKTAVVHWTPPVSIKKMCIMFWRFAYGDTEAGILRPKVLFLFFRYFLLSLILGLGINYHSTPALIAFAVLLFLYLLWSIQKNYRYVRLVKAIFTLPYLQILSDIAVMIGTVCGGMKKLFQTIQSHKILTAIIGIYIITCLSQINWGIPDISRVFNYHMDEWHQLMSVRSVFKHGSPNIEGAANGSMFQFILSGMYLIPFIAFGLVHPLTIKSSIGSLDQQHILFLLLRINTMLFGIGSIIIMYLTAKRLFRFSPIVTVSFFVFTPVFLTLSNYFKYDIALLFWINLAMYFLYSYILNKKKHDFYVGSAFAGIALATKLSAIPLILIILVAFLLAKINKWKILVKGYIAFFVCFLFLGIPDIFFHLKDYTSFVVGNVQSVPNTSDNYYVSHSIWVYIYTILYPSYFGAVLYVLATVGLCVIVYRLITCRSRVGENSLNTFFVISFLLFFASLITLKLFSTGNRTLVLLPFIALFGAFALQMITQRLAKIGMVIAIVCIASQVVISYSWIAIKLSHDPRAVSSTWMVQHIPHHSIIGIENIPIYNTYQILLHESFMNSKARSKDLTYSHMK